MCTLSAGADFFFDFADLAIDFAAPFKLAFTLLLHGLYSRPEASSAAHGFTAILTV